MQLSEKIKDAVLSRKINAVALLPAGLTARISHNKTASLSFYNLHADIRAHIREDEREQRPKGMSSAIGVLLSSLCSKQIGSRRYLRVHRVIRGLIKVEGSTRRSGFSPNGGGREERRGIRD